ncbi:VOC family protein [Virgibacillus oceani]
MKNQATPYFLFDGNAREALEFYKEVFEGDVSDIQTFGEADYPTPPEANDRIIHARFKKDDLFIMLSDTFPGQEVKTGNHISLALELESEEEIQKLYNALSQKGSVLMELQDTFWGAKYAKLKIASG